MKCKQCGTEIADKAIVCYRCGTATTEPTYKAPSSGQTRSPVGFVITILALLVIGVLAIYLTRTFSPQNSGVLSWVIVAFAVVIVALRGFARRMRR